MKVNTFLRNTLFFKVNKQFVLDFFETYPEETRPSKILKFCDIIPISAKENTDDVRIVKDRLRKLLDVLVELDAKKEIEDNAELYEKARQSVSERGPALV